VALSTEEVNAPLAPIVSADLRGEVWKDLFASDDGGDDDVDDDDDIDFSA